MHVGSIFARLFGRQGNHDPLSATMGRGRVSDSTDGMIGHHPEPQWFAQVHQLKKEVAVVICILFGVLTAIVLVYCLDFRSRHLTEKWADQAWIETSCIVNNLGVAYRGNCGEDVVRSFGSKHQDFAECTGDSSLSFGRKERNECVKRGDNDFSRAGQEGRILQASQTPARRRCHDGYLAWAEVSVTDPILYIGGNLTASSSSVEVAFASRRPTLLRCAYQYGAAAPSTTGEWDVARGLLERLGANERSPSGVKCWALAADSCVIALESAEALSIKEEGSHKFANAICMFFGCISAIAAMFAFHWHCRDLHGLEDDGLCNFCFGMRIPAGYECSVPLEDPGMEQRLHADEGLPGMAGPSPLSERVRRLVDIAAARFGENTPGASGETTLRLSERGSRRTVEVGGAPVSRNFAADFVS